MAPSNGLRTAGRTALLAGSAGSILLMMRAGARQRSALLILLFTGWVLSPFLALAIAAVRARGWHPNRQTALYGTMLGVSFVSLSVYALHAIVPGMKAGFIYLVVPAACWLLIALALVTAASVSPRRRP